MTKLRVLDLFSGIGGFSLGLERTGGFETVAFCEIDAYCRRVLSRHWPSVPCFSDVREIDGGAIGPVDVITGGYPCQPFSVAGKRRGAEDDRHLWPEMYRLVDECGPAWVIGENVAGHISMGLDEVLSDLEALGYTARPFVVPACAVDAPHRRDRVWIVANAARERRREARTDRERLAQRPAGSRSLSHADNGDAQGQQRSLNDAQNREAEIARSAGLHSGTRRHCQWPAEPDVGRVGHGIPKRVDRLKALGNAVVPQIPEMIGHAILVSIEEREAVAA